MSISNFEKPSQRDRPKTLVELLRTRSQAPGGSTGYTFLADGEAEKVSITHTQLDLQARAIASWIQKEGFAGQRALLLYPAGLDVLSGFFGCLYSGVVPIPFPISKLRRESSVLKSLCNDAEPSLVLGINSQVNSVERSFEQASISMKVLATDSIPLELAKDWSEPVLDTDDLAYLQYTSGSTTSPKGVMITHRNVLHNLSYIDAGFKHSNGSGSVTWLPYYHDMGLVYGILQPLYNAFPCWVMSPTAFSRRPLRWLEAISKFRATHSGGPNFAFDVCWRAVVPGQCSTLDLSHWVVAFVGAEPIRSETLERFAQTFAVFGFRSQSFYPAYGLAEATLKVTGGSHDAGPTLMCVRTDYQDSRIIEAKMPGPGVKTLVGCGHASHGVEIRIIDPGNGSVCQELEIGEIWISGPGNARGYWKRLEETQITFGAAIPSERQPFLRTGDLGFLRGSELFVTGRIKDLIVIRGRNYYPQDIERTAESCDPILGQAVAFSITINNEEKVTILQEVRRHTSSDFAAAFRTIRQAVAVEHELQIQTVALVPLGKLLRTSSGKIQRQACRASFLNGEMEIIAVESLRPQSKMSRPTLDRGKLASISNAKDRLDYIVAYILDAAAGISGTDLRRIDPSLSSNVLGLDSLQAVTLQGQIEDALGISLPAFAFLQSSSIRNIASQAVTPTQEAMAGILKTRSISRQYQPNESYPLSPEQERIWILAHRGTATNAYNVSFSFRIKGRLNVIALQESVHAVMLRQAALRIHFTAVNGHPVQQVSDQLVDPVPLVDLSDLADIKIEHLIKTIARQMQEEEFNLSAPPLFRCQLIRAGDTEYVFVAAAHHIIVDAISFDIFLNELVSMYSLFSKGVFCPVEPLSPSYVDCVLWQRALLNETDLSNKRAFWRERLTPLPPQIYLPDEEEVTGIVNLVREEESIFVSGKVLDAVMETATRGGVTLFMILVAAFKATLYSLSGETDILLTSTTNGRTHPETRSVIGFFAYPILLRTNLSGDPTLREVLDRVRITVLESLVHGDVPFATVLENIPPSNLLSRRFTDLIFNFINTKPLPVFSDDIEMGPLELQRPTTDAAMFVNVMPLLGGLRASITYDPRRFSCEIAKAILKLYSKLVSQIVNEPDTRLSGLISSVRTETHWKLTIASSFVTDPLEEVLEFWRDQLDFSWQIDFAPYGQLMQSLLDPNTPFARNHTGLRVLLVRLLDWVIGGTNELQRGAEQFIHAVRALAELGGAPVLLCFCPATPAMLGDILLTRELEELERGIADELSRIAGIDIIKSTEMANSYPLTDYDDPFGNSSVHIPYLPQWYVSTGMLIAKKVYDLRVPPYKAIALDCDHTLWGGICGEDGTLGVTIDETRRGLQEFLLSQQKKGFVLCLCSKNNREDVQQIFLTRSEMVLGWDDFASVRINWNSKSANLRSLAAELGIGLDSFIFIDDDPVECAEVKHYCPEVLTLRITRKADEALLLLKRNWAFDRGMVTPEAKLRSALYKAQHRRDDLKRGCKNLEDYLADLNLEVRIRSAEPKDIPRVSELTLRVNQFNFTSIRRSVQEVQILLAGDSQCAVVEVADRFGPYGLVGVMFFREGTSTVDVDSFILSCRALGRGVEHQMLAELGRIAQQRRCSIVKLPFVRTQKNSPVREFLKATVSKFCYEQNDRLICMIPAEYAVRVVYNPSDLPQQGYDTALGTEELINLNPKRRASGQNPGPRLGTNFHPNHILKTINSRRRSRRLRDSVGSIQSCLRQHPAVKDALVLLDDQGPQQRSRIVAFVSTGASSDLSTEELRWYLNQNQAGTALPSAFLIVESFPRTEDGTINLTALREITIAAGNSFDSEDKPMTPVEEMLAAIWAETLGLESVGVRESFLELGGDSILAMQILSRVRSAFHIELPITILFGSVLTVAKLAEIVEQRKDLTVT